jgi:glycine oxidase
MRALVIGAGVAGLTAAHELAARGAAVTLAEIRGEIAGNASWFAGGMLAPWCERESAEPVVLELGEQAADWWDAALSGAVTRAGTLVLARSRDMSELDRFASRTTGHVRLGEDEIAALEPDLAGSFRRGLYFSREAHLDPRRTMLALERKLAAMGVAFRFSTDGRRLAGFDHVVDCCGMGARQAGLRGVRGEMLILRTPEISLSRPVRLLHPRFPLYVVPRADNHFMVGATMIESDAAGPITARSTMELLNAAYGLHPAFGEAEIVEAGVGVRPAFADSIPRVGRNATGITINGLYRHGFLLAPSLAREAADLILNRANNAEPQNETDGQRRSA